MLSQNKSQLFKLSRELLILSRNQSQFFKSLPDMPYDLQQRMLENLSFQDLARFFLATRVAKENAYILAVIQILIALFKKGKTAEELDIITLFLAHIFRCCNESRTKAKLWNSTIMPLLVKEIRDSLRSSHTTIEHQLVGSWFVNNISSEQITLMSFDAPMLEKLPILLQDKNSNTTRKRAITLFIAGNKMLREAIINANIKDLDCNELMALINNPTIAFAKRLQPFMSLWPLQIHQNTLLEPQHTKNNYGLIITRKTRPRRQELITGDEQSSNPQTLLQEQQEPNKEDKALAVLISRLRYADMQYQPIIIDILAISDVAQKPLPEFLYDILCTPRIKQSKIARDAALGMLISQLNHNDNECQRFAIKALGSQLSMTFLGISSTMWDTALDGLIAQLHHHDALNRIMAIDAIDKVLVTQKILAHNTQDELLKKVFLFLNDELPDVRKKAADIIRKILSASVKIISDDFLIKFIECLSHSYIQCYTLAIDILTEILGYKLLSSEFNFGHLQILYRSYVTVEILQSILCGTSFTNFSLQVRKVALHALIAKLNHDDVQIKSIAAESFDKILNTPNIMSQEILDTALTVFIAQLNYPDHKKQSQAVEALGNILSTSHSISQKLKDTVLAVLIAQLNHVNHENQSRAVEALGKILSTSNNISQEIQDTILTVLIETLHQNNTQNQVMAAEVLGKILSSPIAQILENETVIAIRTKLIQLISSSWWGGRGEHFAKKALRKIYDFFLNSIQSSPKAVVRPTQVEKEAIIRELLEIDTNFSEPYLLKLSYWDTSNMVVLLDKIKKEVPPVSEPTRQTIEKLEVIISMLTHCSVNHSKGVELEAGSINNHSEEAEPEEDCTDNHCIGSSAKF